MVRGALSAFPGGTTPMAQAATLSVDLVAHTMVEPVLTEYFPTDPDVQTATDADYLAEAAGRLCYKSESRPNPRTRENRDYLGNILALQHESVLSHATATFRITGVSRSLTHELIRHRWFSFSELSQRYVDARDFEFVIPPAFEGPLGMDEVDSLEFTFEHGVRAYEDAYRRLVEFRKLPLKEARQAARAHLPNCTATEIMASSNLRGWRDFIKQRHTPGADAEIYRLAERILTALDSIAPNTMQDLS